jgi:hypothetical protein
VGVLLSVTAGASVWVVVFGPAGEFATFAVVVSCVIMGSAAHPTMTTNMLIWAITFLMVLLGDFMSVPFWWVRFLVFPVGPMN